MKRDINFLLAGGFVASSIRRHSSIGLETHNTMRCLQTDLERGAKIMQVINDNMEEIENIFRTEGGNNGSWVLGPTNDAEFQGWLADNLEDLYDSFK